MAPTDSLWEVVGGAAKGGLVVREGREQGSAELPGRLSTGALVLPLEHDVEAERLHYELVEGSGPEHGWVSTAFRGKALLVPAEEDASTEEAGSVEDSMTEELTVEEMSNTEDAAGLAMQLYCARFGEAESEGEELTGQTALQDCPAEPAEAEAETCAELVQDLSTEEPTSEAAEESDDMEDSGLTLCRHCRLPVGQVAYHAKEGEEGVLHGECVAQCMLLELRKEEEKRKQDAAQEKVARRAEYEIGWKAAEHVPSNAGPAAKLSCGAPQGMCCLVFDAETRSASLASTVEPAAAVNLEYLSTALEVRRRENREPLFSLDPVDAESEFFDPKASMLVKRFEPAWLAGTSVGEVLFQSDYHLKELSMGEYEQPVVGMRSCHDFSCGDGPEWSAREWFVVRKAEVRVSGDNVLMPSVKMGVEAREQIRGENGLEDVPTTKPNHPLVKYAEMFTHNFDLIAERKSVVYHLRELAKASVLAKFLMEADVDLDESWFNLASDKKEACSLEIPQLWNDRSHSQIRVQDGTIVNADSAVHASSQSLYGGVQFGLDKFQLSGARQPARMMSAGLAARQFVQPARHLSATLSAGLATRQFQRSFGPMGVQPARVSAGVGLDKFALSGARQPARMMSAGLAARQFVQPARHLSATLSAGLATRQFQRSFGPMGVQPARVSAGVGLDKFALSGARQPARMMSAGLAARQFVQPARHLSATLSAGLATRQFQRSFGPMGVQPARVSAGVGLDKFALSGARQPARMMSAGLAARQFVQPARHLSATLSAGLATRQFQRSFGPMGVQPARVSAGVGLDKFALSGARQPARMMSAGLAARQFVQPARHLSATLSAGLATRQFQRSFGPMGVQPARVSAGVGLDKFALSGARQPARMMSAGLAARQFVQPARHLSATLSAGLATRQFQRSFGPMGVQPARVAGVDLNLDEFNLSAPSEDARDVFVQLDAGADISTEFWSNLSNEFPSMFSEADKNLLNKVFNPCLSDRRDDGDCFIPPDTSFAYVQKLRSLVKEEEAMQQQRREHFLSKAFAANEPGPLFPSTWASSVEISREDGASKQGGFLDARPEYKAQAHMFEQALKTAVPVFDKATEDGARFRIYKIGSLEVRTTREYNGQEMIGMVFSTRSSVRPTKLQPLKDGEKIVKAIEYVERVAKGHHCYVVMETDAHNVIISEQLADGAMKHEENPRNLEDRNSLAKVFRSADCSSAKVTVGNVRSCQKDLYSMLCGC